MSTQMDIASTQKKIINFKKQSQLKEIWRRYKKNKMAMFGLIVIVALLLVAVLADFIRPYEYAITMNLREKLQPVSVVHIFGTDGYGRDLFARCIHGARVSLLVGFTTSAFSMFIGAIIGAIVGYYGGKVDDIIMRVMDIFSAIPTILLALVIVAAFGASVPNLIMALTIARISGFVRIVRSSVLGIADQEFIEAAKAGGTRDRRIMLKQILPNAMGPVIVQATMNVADMILAAAALSFLGLGVSPPKPEWGAIISEAKEFLRTAPHLMFFPGALIIISSLSINLVGDGLRDSLDPRLKS